MTTDAIAPTPAATSAADEACTSRFLASDNTSGICPEAMAYMMQANRDDDLAYGNDRWTQQVTDSFRQLFETECEVFFVFNGTAANSLSLAHLCQSYHSVICHELAHIETDECGGPEFFSNGSKLLNAPGPETPFYPAEAGSGFIRRAGKRQAATGVQFPS